MKSVSFFIIASSILCGCVSMSDFENAQQELNKNAASRKVCENSLAAAKATTAKCQKPDEKGKWSIEYQKAIPWLSRGKGQQVIFLRFALKKFQVKQS